VRRSGNAMARTVGDDLVILDVRSGRYFELNDVGSLVWERLEHEVDVESLVDAVAAEFDAPRDVVFHDVEVLLGDLIKAGLVAVDT
jgi:hypothetical protein